METERAKKRAREETEEDEDYISKLPKVVLAFIISRLSLRQAVKTSILSRPWRRVWTSVPHLELDFSIRGRKNNPNIQWSPSVDSILRLCDDPILSCNLSYNLYDRRPAVDRFVSILSSKHVQNLRIANHAPCYQRYPVPPLLFLNSPLRSLRLEGCIVTLPCAFQGLGLLKSLELCSTEISDQALDQLVSLCPELERLEVSKCGGFQHARIRTPNLRFLHITFPSPIDIFLDRCLDHLLDLTILLDAIRKFREQGLRLVSLLKHLTRLERLSLHAQTVRCLSTQIASGKLPLSFPHLMRLSIGVNLVKVRQLDVLSTLMKCSPCLQSIEIQQVYSHKGKNFVPQKDYWKMKTCNCLIHHVTEISLVDVDFKFQQAVQLGKFLFQNAQVLRKMKISYHTYPEDEELWSVIVKNKEAQLREVDKLQSLHPTSNAELVVHEHDGNSEYEY